MLKTYVVAVKRTRYELVDVLAYSEKEAERMAEEDQGIHHMTTTGKIEVLSMKEKGETFAK